MKYYYNLTTKEKKDFKAKLSKIKEISLKQVKQFELMYLKPLNDRIILIDEVLKGNIPIEVYIKRNQIICDYIKEVLK